MFIKNLLLVTVFSTVLFALNVELTVKECAGVGSSGYPITTVVPLGKGLYQDVSKFRLTDGSGNTVPAQIEILNRRWASDRSIANLQITYFPTVSAFSGSGTGVATYYLKDDGSASTGASVSATETANDITVVTGPLKFIVKKSGFNVFDQVWYDNNSNGSFDSDELVVKSNSHNGGQLIGRKIDDPTFQLLGPSQYDADRSDVTCTIEKRGPGEVVIRAEAVTKYYGPSDHTHGWAVRIYAYAGKPYIKIDYQLQNSAKTKKYGWPLYFHALNLNFDLNLGSNVNVKIGLGNGTVYSGARSNGVLLAQKKDSLFNVYSNDGIVDTASVLSTGGRPDGFMDIDDGNVGVTTITRNFWRQWPNGLKIDNTNRLSVELFPNWSANVNAATKSGVLNSSHLYWLLDMQHVYKEVVFNFHNSGASDADLIALSKTVDFHPVATLPLTHVGSAQASLNMEGFIPLKNKISTTDSRKPSELASNYLGWNYYAMNWEIYGEPTRRAATSMVGGWPFEGAKFWASENPSDWFVAERDLLGEINLRPEWMAQYNHAVDYPTLHLGKNSVGGTIVGPAFSPVNIRCEDMGKDMWDSSGLAPTIETPQTGKCFTLGLTSCLDNAHLWRYHVADAYWITGNPWLKDFYKFQAEYRKNTLTPGLVEGAGFSRDYAHIFAEAWQAYQVTGDTSLVRMMTTFVQDILRKTRKEHIQYGAQSDAWQVGFFLRPMIDIMNEIRETDPQGWAEVFQCVSGAIDWNLNYGNFSDKTPAPLIGISRYSSYELLDPQAWYYWNTGKHEVLDQLNQYIDWGIGNGGSSPVDQGMGGRDGIDRDWQGNYSGRWIQLVRTTSKKDSIPPAPIADLRLQRTGNQCTLEWTAPAAAKKYHVVWDSVPIAAKSTSDLRYRNWWAARVAGTSLSPTPGAKEHLTFTVPSTGYKLLFAAVFSWDSSMNMSAMSNVACQDTTIASAPGLRAVVVDANTIHLTWSASSDPESGIWRYIVYKNGVKQAEVDTLAYLSENLQPTTDYSYDVSALSGSNVEGYKAHIDIQTIADTARPTVSTIYSVSLLPQIVVYFSEYIDSVSAQTASNYTLNQGRIVKNARLLPDVRSVLLTCDSLGFLQTYQLIINNVKDLAPIPNTIAANTKITFVHKEPLRLDSLWQIDIPNTPVRFSWDTCKVGKSPFMDWSFPISQIPPKYINLPMLRTTCADLGISNATNELFSFIPNKAIHVYVMVDRRQTTLPTWLKNGYTKTGDTLLVKNTEGVVDIYASKAAYPANIRIMMPGLAGNVAYMNYFIVAEPLDSSWVVLNSTEEPEPATQSMVWDFTNSTEGWVADDGKPNTAANGVLTVTGWQAATLSPASLNMLASKYAFVKVVIQNRSTDSLAMFTFSNGGSFNSTVIKNNTIKFKMVPSDSIFRTYILDLRPAKIGYKFVDTVQQIRFQFISHTATTNSDTAKVDRIEIMPDTTLPVVQVEEPGVQEFEEGMAAYPNPFNPTVNIMVQCKTAGVKQTLPVAFIYNIQGRVVARIVPTRVRLASKTARYEYLWNGVGFASGAYLVFIHTGNKNWKKMVLLMK